MSANREFDRLVDEQYARDRGEREVGALRAENERLRVRLLRVMGERERWAQRYRRVVERLARDS